MVKEKSHKKDKKKKRSHSDSSDHERKHKKSKHHGREKEKEKEKEAEKLGVAPAVQLTSDDYYNRHAEFSYWLRKKKGVYFDSLKAEDTRPAFDKFVKKWNAGDLSAKYYDAGGSGGSKEEEAKTRTMYKWKFASKLGKSDQKAQESLRSEVSSAKTVDMQTGAALVAPSVLESTSRGGGGGRVGAAAAAGGGGPVVKKRVLGPSAPPREMLQDYSRALKRKDDHDFRKHKEMVVDELSGGRPTGRDAKMEKKMIGRQARSDRDASPEAGGGSAGGSASMYASGKEDFRSAVNKRNRRSDDRRSAKQEVARTKLSSHMEAEKAKMAALVAMAQQSRSANSMWQPK